MACDRSPWAVLTLSSTAMTSCWTCHAWYSTLWGPSLFPGYLDWLQGRCTGHHTTPVGNFYHKASAKISRKTNSERNPGHTENKRCISFDLHSQLLWVFLHKMRKNTAQALWSMKFKKVHYVFYIYGISGFS